MRGVARQRSRHALVHHWFNINSAEPAQTIEKAWNTYWKHKGLDFYGKANAATANITGCVHSESIHGHQG
jgi:hypothetical protein